MKEHKSKKFFGNAIISFSLLILITMIASLIGNKIGLQTSYLKVDAVTGDIESTIVGVVNLFHFSELKNIIGNAFVNFVGFTPVASFLIATIGIGVATKTGLLKHLFTRFGKKINRFWMTFLLALISIIITFISDTGFVILIPLAALFYYYNNRNPIGAIITSFVALISGQGINFVLSNLEYNLLPYTESGAKLIDPNFILGNHTNLFFMIAGTISLAFLITYITEKITLYKLNKYPVTEEELIVTKSEKNGLFLAGIGGIILLLLFIYITIPGLPGSGLLLDTNKTNYLDQLYGNGSYFSSSITYLISIVLFVSGILYGLGSRVIKTKEEFSKIIYSSLDKIGSFLVLLFLASQLIAIFRRSNIGIVFNAYLIDLVNNLNFSALPLIVLIIIVVFIANLFLTSSATKWAIMSPVIIPSMMKSNITAEFSQVIFRIGESASNIMTPLSTYFIMLIGYLELYNKNDEHISFSNCYRLLWPYIIAIFLLWLILIISWYIIGLPIGFGTYPTV